MAFNYSVTVNDPTNAGGAVDSVLQYDLQQALGVWSQYISGKGTLVVELDIANTTQGREAGGPTSSANVGINSQGVSIYESSAQYELTTGSHVNGTASDIKVTIDPGYFKYLDTATSLTYNSAVPNNEYNPIVLFLHELMHGLGQSGWYSSTGTLPGNYESNFDNLIQTTSSGTAFFTGANAEAMYGGPVPITTNSTAGENYYHFGNNQSDIFKTPATAQDPLTLDLMNGIVFYFNHQYPISNLDLAVLLDLGYNISPFMTAAAMQGTSTLSAGHSVTITLDFIDPVTISGKPLLTLDDGGTATYSGGSGGKALNFTYTLGANDGNPAALAVSAINLNGGSIQDGNGDAADLSFANISQNAPQIVLAVSAAAAIAANSQTPAIISDSAANVQANLGGLETLAAAGKLASITLTDGGIPVFSLTTSQLAGDGPALSDISGIYDVTTIAASPNVTVNGPAGHGTTVIFGGTASQYGVSGSGDGTSFTVTNTGSVDHLSNITALQFSDHTVFVASTLTGGAGASSFQVTTLYAAVLNRVPDVAGLAYYEALAAANPGLAITTFAEDFLQSPEYTGAHNYPQTSTGDAAFITDTYNNLLHRGPGTGDVAWYQTNVINPLLNGQTAGTAAYGNAELLAHAMLLADFSQSTEFQGDVQITALHPADARHWLMLI